MKASTIRQKLNLFPPCLCRCVARIRHGRRPLQRKEIAARSGLPLRKVDELSRLTSWDRVPVEEMERFSLACGVDLLRLRRHVEFMFSPRSKKAMWGHRPEFYAKAMLTLQSERQRDQA